MLRLDPPLQKFENIRNGSQNEITLPTHKREEKLWGFDIEPFLTIAYDIRLSQSSLRVSQIPYHSHVWDHRSTGQL